MKSLVNAITKFITLGRTSHVNRISMPKWLGYVSVSILIAFFVFPLDVFYTPGTDLDRSWAMALHMAIDKNFVFGDDFIFTYGPLGYITTRYPIGINKFQIIFFDFYILVMLAFCVFNILKTSNKLTTVVYIFLTSYLFGNIFNNELVFILGWILLCLTFIYLKGGSKVVLANTMFISVILFFIKMNVGAISTILFSATIIINLFLKKITLREFGIYMALQFFLFLFFCLVCNVNFFGYLLGSIEIVKGYTDAMYGTIGDSELADIFFNSAVLIFAGFALICVINIRRIIFDFILAFQLSSVALLSFIAFKQAFVRGSDFAHLSTFFAFCPILIGLVTVYANSRRLQYQLGILATIVLGISYINLKKIDIVLPEKWAIENHLNNVKTYTKSIFSKNGNAPNYSFLLKDRVIPSKILNEINGGTVDIIPWEITYIGLNGLNYAPRPVIQSYSAYTPYLDQKNYERYISAKAPDYVFFSNQTIDDRYAFWDESKTKKALLENYELIFPQPDSLKKSNYPIKNSTKPVAYYDENYYLTTYPDVGNAVKNGVFKSGFDHFQLWGRQEGRIPIFIPFAYDEGYYCSRYEDIRMAVKNETFKVGLDHYNSFGYKEGRISSEIAMLFKKRESRFPSKETLVLDTVLDLNKYHDVPVTTEPLFLYADLEMTWKGRFKKALFRPGFSKIILKFENGDTISYRAIAPILEGGVLINRKVTTNTESYLYFNTLGAENQRIVAFCIKNGNFSEIKTHFSARFKKYALVK